MDDFMVNDLIMRGLTLRQPWAYAMEDDELLKRLENRGWGLPKFMHGQLIALHGGAMPKGAILEEYWEDCEYGNPKLAEAFRNHFTASDGSDDWFNPDDSTALRTSWLEKSLYPFVSRVYAVARVREVWGNEIPEDQRVWAAEGQHHWLLEDYVSLEQPVECKGAQGFWALPPNVLEQVMEQWRAVVTEKGKWAKLSETLPGVRHFRVCQCCGQNSLFDLESELSMWREHDDNDVETDVFVMLCEQCNRERSSDGGTARANRKKTLIDAHPRLYSQMPDNYWFPGVMHLCANCEWHSEMNCSHPDRAANGGTGTLEIDGTGFSYHVKMTRKAHSGYATKFDRAKSCSGHKLKEARQ
jgi:hypothetical protein